MILDEIFDLRRISNEIQPHPQHEQLPRLLPNRQLPTPRPRRLPRQNPYLLPADQHARGRCRLGFVVPVQSTVFFIKVQDPDERECQRLLRNKGVDINSFVKGKTIKNFYANNHSEVRIVAMPNTGYFRIITTYGIPRAMPRTQFVTVISWNRRSRSSLGTKSRGRGK
jgi:hypothetical protein